MECKMTKILQMLIVVEIMFLVWFGGSTIYDSPFKKEISKNTHNDLEYISGMNIVENVIIESPSIIFTFDKFDEFKIYCKGRQIYLYDSGYFVFSEDLQTAYKYSLKYDREDGILSAFGTLSRR